MIAKGLNRLFKRSLVILLNYSVDLASNEFDLNQDARISFGQNSLQFQCQYLRNIDVSDTMNIDPTPTPGPIIGTGDISYEMESVLSSGVGGTTTVTIRPLHNLNIEAV